MPNFKDHEQYGLRVQFDPWAAVRGSGWRPVDQPNKQELALIEEIKSVLVEYEGYKLTKRQVYYRLVARGVGSKSEMKFHNQVMTAINRGLFLGYLKWHAFRDPSRQAYAPGYYGDPKDYWEYCRGLAYGYKLNAQWGQPVYLTVRVEANGMVDTIQDWAYEHSIPVYASGGQASHTTLREQAVRIAIQERGSAILLIGDLDTAGKHIKANAEARIRYFLRELDAEEKLLDVVNVAVTEEQADQYDLPRDPDHPDVIQAEALDPAQLRAELEAAKVAWTNVPIENHLLKRQEEEKNKIVGQINALAPDDEDEEDDDDD